MTVRTVFMGSPEFSLPTLAALAKHYPIAGVVTQPDRPAGRGRALTPPPVKSLALELGLPVIQPRRLKDPESMEALQAWAPELIVVAAFGQILRPAVLDLPRYGCINVHASLLPRWRGAAPIQAAILAGDGETGATIMRMDSGVDTGPVLAQRSTRIGVNETAGELAERLAPLGAELLIETLPAYLLGNLLSLSQEALPGEPTYAPMLKKEDGLLDFNRPAAELARQVRAFHPWPGAFLLVDGQPLKVHRAQAHHGRKTAPEPGQRSAIDGLPAVSTPDGWLVMEEVQPAGKKAMPGSVFLRGARGWS